jgi:hypothetical protein
VSEASRVIVVKTETELVEWVNAFRDSIRKVLPDVKDGIAKKTIVFED